jgi:uncharacterized protein (TIGR00730 family)
MRNHQPVAYEIPEFLQSGTARPVRILAEYLEPLRRFKKQNIQDTVVFFGSARVHSRTRAQRALAHLRKRPKKTTAYRDQLKRLRIALEWSRYYEDARRLAYLLTEWALKIDSERHRFVVCSGGGPGIMEAANRGAYEAGGKTIGLNIRLPFEQGANRYVTRGLGFEFHYFFMRKFWFAYMAKALVIFPGGFGTLDEMFEIMTLAQTQKLSEKIDVILYGTEYWDQIFNLKPMVEWGAVAPEDLEIVHRVSSPEEAFERLREHLVRHLEPERPQTPGLAVTRG